MGKDIRVVVVVVVDSYMVAVGKATSNTVGRNRDKVDKTSVAGHRNIAILPVGTDHEMRKDVVDFLV